jgi:hypothetical protein
MNSQADALAAAALAVVDQSHCLAYSKVVVHSVENCWWQPPLAMLNVVEWKNGLTAWNGMEHLLPQGRMPDEYFWTSKEEGDDVFAIKGNFNFG